VDRERRERAPRAMEVEKRLERLINDDVAVKDQKWCRPELPERIPHRSCRPQQLRLDDARDLERPSIACHEGGYLRRQVVCVDHDAGNLLSLEVLEMSFEERASADIHKHLRDTLAKATEPRASSGCKNHCVHEGRPSSADTSCHLN
jgi:hypothetical protein